MWAHLVNSRNSQSLAPLVKQPLQDSSKRPQITNNFLRNHFKESTKLKEDSPEVHLHPRTQVENPRAGEQQTHSRQTDNTLSLQLVLHQAGMSHPEGCFPQALPQTRIYWVCTVSRQVAEHFTCTVPFTPCGRHSYQPILQWRNSGSKRLTSQNT